MAACAVWSARTEVSSRVTASPTATTPAVAAKILRVSPPLTPAALVALTPGPRPVLLAVLVAVLAPAVAAGVEREGESRQAAGRDRDLPRRFRCALVPDVDRVGPRRHVGDLEGAVRAGLRVPAVVAHHEERAH